MEEAHVGTGFVLVWGLALLAIAALLAALALTLRHGTRSVPEPDSFQPFEDRLLFQYEENSTCVSTDARVIVHIPGIAWDAGWRSDLLRLDVAEKAPDVVDFPAELGDVDVLVVYDLAAFRMTDAGTDIPVERFLEPVDVILTTERTDRDLGLATRADSTWIMASTTASSVWPHELEGVSIPHGRGWAAVTTTRLGRVCLVQLRGR
jgi:hypothetical protein